MAQQKQQREAKSPQRSAYNMGQGSTVNQVHPANIASQSHSNMEVSGRYDPQPEPKKVEEDLGREPSPPREQLVEKVTEKAPSPELVQPPTVDERQE